MLIAYGSDDTGAVGADQAGLVLGLEDVGDADHVYIKTISLRASCAIRTIRTVLRDTLSNAIEENPVSLKLLIGRQKKFHWFDTYQTTRPISAAMASSIPAAARGGLTAVSAIILVSSKS
jgi:hypothetical protein